MTPTKPERERQQRDPQIREWGQSEDGAAIEERRVLEELPTANLKRSELHKIVGNSGRSRVRAIILATLAALIVLGGCHESEPTMGSETHFLRSCAALCPEGSDCVCGVCTQSCAATNECAALDVQASCVATAPRISEGRCVDVTPSNVCDLACLTDTDCAALNTGYSCQAGFCRSKKDADTSNESPPASNSCTPIAMTGQDLLVMGDAHIALTSFVAHLEERAVAAGIIQAGENLRSSASALTSWLAPSAGALSLNEQYSVARQAGSTRIIVMDGGETDLLEADCGSDLSYDCPVLKNAVTGAQLLFRRFADDGVEHVVYFFPPDPSDDPLLQKHLSALRPLIRNVCGQAPIACHWIDLREPFIGLDDYLGDGIIMSNAGASVAAALVWERMQARCLVPNG